MGFHGVSSRAGRRRSLIVLAMSLLLLASSLACGCGSSHGTTDGASDATPDRAGDRMSPTDSADSADATGDRSTSICAHGTDCVLAPATCCGHCGTYSRDDIRSVHKDDARNVPSPCEGDVIGCPACYAEPDPNLQPACSIEGGCTWMDLRDWSSCDSDDDCILRVVACCECGAMITPSNLVAVHKDYRSDLEEVLCPPDTRCATCGLTYEPYFTRCGADTADGAKSCRVDLVGP
jgi:hypothetical protein